MKFNVVQCIYNMCYKYVYSNSLFLWQMINYNFSKQSQTSQSHEVMPIMVYAKNLIQMFTLYLKKTTNTYLCTLIKTWF